MRLAVLFLVFGWLSFVNAAPSLNRMAQDLYKDHLFTFFCEQPFQKDFTLQTRACDLCPLQVEKIQWMRIIPSKRLAQHRLCYQKSLCFTQQGNPQKGLSCCRKIDTVFQIMEQDLYNLAPEDPRLKSINEKFMIGKITNTTKMEICDMRQDKKQKIFQPPNLSLGAVARTYLYFNQEYLLPLTQEEKNILLEWHFTHPASPWEKERAHRIFLLQGKRNPWILN